MSDTSELWAEFRSFNKTRCAQNLAKADTTKFDKHTDYHFSTTLNGDRLDYWPSRNRWRWRGKTYTGNVHGFIRKREL